MPKHLIRVALLACLATSLGLLAAQSSPQSKAQSSPSASPHLDDPQIDQKIESLLRGMTLEEKVGQLVQYSAGQATGPGTGRTDYEDMLAKGEIGALFNITTARETNAYQHIAVEKSRLHIPILFSLDVIHGFRTEFPIPLALASTWDAPLVEQTMRIAAREASATGIRVTFSPMVDIARDARWGRMAEGSGEDPYLGELMARAYVRGYQGKRLDAPDSVAACPKHFVGYGAAEGGRDYNSTEISEHTLRQFYLPPFKAAIDEGALSIMSAFNSLNGIPTSADPFTLKQILRKEWNFRGFVDSDWTSVGELIAHGIATDPAMAARRAFLAGVDMDMVSSFYHDNLAKLVRSGEVPQSDIDESVRRVLRVKFALGLFDHPYTDEALESAAMLKPDSVALARTAAERSFVLLKNSSSANGAAILPLSAETKSVALIGPLADDAPDMLGSWTAQGKPQDVVTLRSALTQKFGADSLLYAKGSGIRDGSDADLDEAVKIAQQSDVVLLALGESAPEMTGEAASRAHLGLPGRQQQLLERIVATGKPVVVILFSGRPLTLPWAFEHVPAVIAAWFPGIQAGPALVNILTGVATPTGRLAVTWPRAVGQEPLYYNALPTGRPARTVDLSRPPTNSDEKFVSRYIDEENTPQFPFGFGLSYGRFEYGQTIVTADAHSLTAKRLNAQRWLVDPPPGQVAHVSADVKNTSTSAGDETVQLYMRLEGTTVSLPVRSLKAFQRVTLSPGESRKVTFDLSADDFAFWNAENKFTVEPARVTFWIAPDSAHGQAATLEIKP